MLISEKDYYQRLSVVYRDPLSLIEQAYEEEAKGIDIHEDVAKLIDITEAWLVLSNEKARPLYDLFYLKRGVEMKRQIISGEELSNLPDYIVSEEILSIARWARQHALTLFEDSLKINRIS